jgi:8-oxo-dGTP pyrophosphatase MutT (NUDIX family)
MQIDFSLPHDDKTHLYCIECHQDGVQAINREGMNLFTCPACGKVSERYIHIGNTPSDGKWWLDDKDEMWHESAGVFVRNPAGRYLFFERTSFPLGFTIPAGHVGNEEAPRQAAIRELREEVGIEARDVTHVLDTDIDGDSCIGGADTHRWHVYREDLTSMMDVEVQEEGKHPVWLTLEEASQKNLPFAIRYLIKHHADQIDPRDK